LSFLTFILKTFSSTSSCYMYSISSSSISSSIITSTILTKYCLMSLITFFVDSQCFSNSTLREPTFYELILTTFWIGLKAMFFFISYKLEISLSVFFYWDSSFMWHRRPFMMDFYSRILKIVLWIMRAFYISMDYFSRMNTLKLLT